MDPPAPFGPGATRRERETVRVGVGVVVLTTENNNGGCVKMYAGRRMGSHGASKLALPGGHLEVNESWEECAAREVEEEMGLQLLTEEVKFLHVTNDIMLEEEKHYVTIFMVGRTADPTAEPENREPHKCEGWDAYTLEELSSMVGKDELFGPLEKLLTEKPSNLLALFKKDGE
jgi:8-oxo-dGTP diphosphatase